MWEKVAAVRLNAPTGAWCSLTRKAARALQGKKCLNAPTGAWCSLTTSRLHDLAGTRSQCTYRCAVLPDEEVEGAIMATLKVSMHLQVRGAP